MNRLKPVIDAERWHRRKKTGRLVAARLLSANADRLLVGLEHFRGDNDRDFIAHVGYGSRQAEL